MNRTKEIIEVLKFGFALQKAIIDSAEDGKWSFMDYTNFLQVIPTVGPAVEGLGTIPKTIATLDASEKNEVMAYAASRFDIANDDLEALVEDTLAQVLDVVTIGNRWSKFRKPSSNAA